MGSRAFTSRVKVHTSVTSRTDLASPSIVWPLASVVAEMKLRPDRHRDLRRAVLERGVHDLDVLEADEGEIHLLLALLVPGDHGREGGEHLGGQERLERGAIARAKAVTIIS